MIGLTDLDRRIGRQIGRLLWYLLPDMYPDTTRQEEDPDLPELWSFPDDDFDLGGPMVEYPVIYMGMERFMGRTERGYEFPGVSGRALPLADYLEKLRLFLIYRYTSPPESSARLVLGAVREVAHLHGFETSVEFVIKLWRGRFLCSYSDIGFLIRSLLTGGGEDGHERLLTDRAGAIEAALDILRREREAKDAAQSMDEWLFEAYCLLPEIFAWFSIIRDMRERSDDDELSKLERVLDEYLADICTTIVIPLLARKDGAGLAVSYAIEPLENTKSTNDARRNIRGIYRGRSIIPKVWFEEASRALDRIATDHLPLRGESFSGEEIDRLNRVDIPLLFGCALTKDGRDEHWMLLGSLIDQWETREAEPGPLSGISISFGRDDDAG